MAANSLTESPRLPGCGIPSHALVPTMSRGVPRRKGDSGRGHGLGLLAAAQLQYRRNHRARIPVDAPQTVLTPTYRLVISSTNKYGQFDGYAALTRDRFRAQASKGPSRLRCEGLFCSRSVRKTAPITHDFSVATFNEPGFVAQPRAVKARLRRRSLG
jgi:hypothetical protein